MSDDLMWYEEPEDDPEFNDRQDYVYESWDDEHEYEDYPFTLRQRIVRFITNKTWRLMHILKLIFNKHYRDHWNDLPF